MAQPTGDDLIINLAGLFLEKLDQLSDEERKTLLRVLKKYASLREFEMIEKAAPVEEEFIKKEHENAK